MPLDDRDYMRKRVGYEPPVFRRAWWKKLSLTAIVGGITAVAGVVALVAMLVGDLSYLSRFLPSREGTLIVNVNTASATELETLPGIGPAIATLIIDDRPYETIEDLDRVQGIGPGKMRSLRPLVIVKGETRKR
ncbi:MAG: helix-hairpin-helix domain-containing protein [Chromatiales bacterium]|nr:helix-hairpin-helix domain-containing protein [Chromatiales bacterium]